MVRGLVRTILEVFTFQQMHSSVSIERLALLSNLSTERERLVKLPILA